MTKEEAIKILEQRECCRECVVDNGDCSDCEKAFDMAIKALEQQSSDDCVSRAEVFEIMGNLMSIPYDFDRPIHEDDVSESMDEIKALPRVTPTYCMAEVKFSKEDLREICNERIEIECTHGTCKDCTNYVVGALDEEICIRGHELIHENFYCADFEKRGNENV